MARNTMTYSAFIAKVAAQVKEGQRGYIQDHGVPGKAPMYGGDHYTGLNNTDRAICPSAQHVKGFTFKDKANPVLVPVLADL